MSDTCYDVDTIHSLGLSQFWVQLLLNLYIWYHTVWTKNRLSPCEFIKGHTFSYMYLRKAFCRLKILICYKYVLCAVQGSNRHTGISIMFPFSPLIVSQCNYYMYGHMYLFKTVPFSVHLHFSSVLIFE